MSDYDDEEDAFRESEETDPVVRELRAEILRMEAQVDQLMASVRERAEESAQILARLTELEESLNLLHARRKRDARVLAALWAAMIAWAALSLYNFFAA